jgi:hypothetical protein
VAWFQVALLWQAGQYHSGQNITLATRGTTMTMKTNNNKRTARWSRQQSSNGQSTENGNHTEGTQHGPTPIPPNIGLTSDTGNKCNKQTRWSKEEMIDVVWCFMSIKATSSTDNYKVA